MTTNQRPFQKLRDDIGWWHQSDPSELAGILLELCVELDALDCRLQEVEALPDKINRALIDRPASTGITPV